MGEFQVLIGLDCYINKGYLTEKCAKMTSLGLGAQQLDTGAVPSKEVQLLC